MITIEREKLEQILECIKAWNRGCYPDEYWREIDEATIAIDSALAQPQRTWVGLTDEEVEKLDCVQALWQDEGECEIHGVKEFYRNIEAKLKEKNT